MPASNVWSLVGSDLAFRGVENGDAGKVVTVMAERIERLLLAVATATLCWHELSEAVLTDEQRRRVDLGWKQAWSIFQLGLRRLARCLAAFLRRLSAFSASLTPICLPPRLSERRR